MSAPLNHTMLAVTFESYPPDVSFMKVPSHISVMPWFDASKLDIACVTEEIREVVEPFAIYPAEEKEYGENGYVKPGRRVEAGALTWFHRTLYPMLVSEGLKFSHPQWLGRRYEPHYTFLKGIDPLSGLASLAVGKLAVITNSRDPELGGNAGIKQINYLRFGE